MFYLLEVYPISDLLVSVMFMYTVYVYVTIQCFKLSCCDVHVYLYTPFVFAVVLPAYICTWQII